jgi:hypothetical protein
MSLKCPRHGPVRIAREVQWVRMDAADDDCSGRQLRVAAEPER